MKHNKSFLVLLLVVAVSFAWVVPPRARSSSDSGMQGPNTQTAQMPVADAAPEGRLTKVDARMVCMVRNHAFDEPQVPIQIKGKTYYGCCEMCKGMLAKDRKQRSALDPVSRRKVDKAVAVIGVGANKGVLYFENETDLERYNASLSQ
jgi:YHS domain-containing protein